MAPKRISTIIFFRLSLLGAISLLIFLTLLALTAWQMTKEVHVTAQFFPTTQNSPTLREFSQLNTISPLEISGKDKEQIEEMLVRYYLEMRYTQIPDEGEMYFRWGVGGPVFFLSLPSLYYDFVDGDAEKKVDGLPDLIRTIDIKSVEHKGNIFIVTFVLYEHLPTGQVQSQQRNVILEYTYAKSRRISSANFTNPYGLIFIRTEEKIMQN